MTLITVRGSTLEFAHCDSEKEGLKAKLFFFHSASFLSIYAESIVLHQIKNEGGGDEPSQRKLKLINIVCGR